MHLLLEINIHVNPTNEGKQFNKKLLFDSCDGVDDGPMVAERKAPAKDDSSL